ncbi:DUF5916 domain-containing protein [Mangrovibacterium marinum]|uniref:Carbohydrate binding protein with CBM9 domain n=1 Tax=Mangrovibacterium marinum TaxID=1639118 RepID=A0A2T5C0E9_9BACT|nr:DUF5916 domain-containing protein [Mangrovibacterium marinum]PTN08028.1 carbohydrate binding protein with CBM9 domain [Mangrovibacterium marinum]
MLLRLSALFLCTFFLVCTQLSGQDAAIYNLSKDSLVNQAASLQKSYSAAPVLTRPKLDGLLDDSCWKTTNWDSDFIQQQPNPAGSPSQKTEIALLYDEANLYVAIRCYESEAGKIRSILTRRDEYGGDMVGIAIDSYGDNRTAFEFDVTAAGQKIDFMQMGAQESDLNWDAIWDAKTSVKDSLWTAEMRIPFSQLRFAKADEQRWGLHIWRYIDRLGEEDHWKLVPVDAPAAVYLFGQLDGIKEINAKRKVELMPYGNLKYSPNTDLKDEWTAGAGVDGKLGLSSDFTVDFTVNPDFGQVEADPSVLTLKSYEVFYDEKRPFFLEGNNVFDFSSEEDLLFYSRRIGHAPSFEPDLEDGQSLSMPENSSIISALKLTGKSKKGLSVGFLHSMTAREEATVYSEDGGKDKQDVEPFTNYLVGRLKQDFNHGNTVLGGMLSSVNRNINESQLDFLPKSALTGGMDFVHNWKKRKYFVAGKGFFSNIKGSEEAISVLQQTSTHYYQRPDADHLDFDESRTRLSGHGGELEGGKRSGKFRAVGSFSWRSPGVDLNDLGYMYQADYLKQQSTFHYVINKPQDILRNYWFRLTQMASWSYGGELTKQELTAHTYLRFTNLWRIHLNLERDYSIFDTRELRGGPILFKDPTWDGELFVQTNSARDLLIGAGARFIRGDDELTSRNQYTLYLRLLLGNNLSLTTNTVYLKNADHHQYAGRVSLDDGSRGYLVGHIDQKLLRTTLRLEYFVTPELSLQYYAAPYASTGKYQSFRRVNDGDNKDMSKRYIGLDGELDKGIYTFTEGEDSYRIYNPDFIFKEFNSNLVARWEFRPGSTLYLVWNRTISDYQYAYDSSITKVFGDIFDGEAQNVFMLKFSYWFTL